MHYGEIEHRSIMAWPSPDDAKELAEEGITNSIRSLILLDERELAVRA